MEQASGQPRLGSEGNIKLKAGDSVIQQVGHVPAPSISRTLSSFGCVNLDLESRIEELLGDLIWLAGAKKLVLIKMRPTLLR